MGCSSWLGMRSFILLSSRIHVTRRSLFSVKNAGSLSFLRCPGLWDANASRGTAKGRRLTRIYRPFEFQFRQDMSRPVVEQRGQGEVLDKFCAIFFIFYRGPFFSGNFDRLASAALPLPAAALSVRLVFRLVSVRVTFLIPRLRQPAPP